MLKHRIIAWNKERGLLDNFDPQLQIRLLTEEAREFHMASTIEHKLAEYADFVFVKVGTLAIYQCQKDLTASSFSLNRHRFIELMGWCEEVEDNMLSILRSMLECNDDVKPEYRFSYSGYDIYEIAIQIVIESNELKSYEMINGKVTKPKDFVKPEIRIAEVLYGS